MVPKLVRAQQQWFPKLVCPNQGSDYVLLPSIKIFRISVQKFLLQ